MQLNPEAVPFEYQVGSVVPYQVMYDWKNLSLLSQIPSVPVIQIQPPFFYINCFFYSPLYLPTSLANDDVLSNYPKDVINGQSQNAVNSLNQVENSPPDVVDTPVLISSENSDLQLTKMEKGFGWECFHGGFSQHKKCSFWRPKLTPGKDLEFIEEEAKFGGKTTVMIKNIPNRYRDMLLELLDKHCKEENENLLKFGSDVTLSEYDFLYLPIDFKNYCNLGYAFVNFTTSTAALKLYKSLHRHTWGILKSKKICEISYARIQGKSSLEEHFRNSYFKCDSDEFLPILLSPPRNGLRFSVSTVVGRRRGKNYTMNCN